MSMPTQPAPPQGDSFSSIPGPPHAGTLSNPQQYWNGSPHYTHPARYDGLAIAGFVTVFFLGPLGFILSLIGLHRTQRNGTRGRGLAIAGITLGSISLAWIALLIFIVTVNTVTSGTRGAHATSAPGTSDTQHITADGHVTDPHSLTADRFLSDLSDQDDDLYTSRSDEELVSIGDYICGALDDGTDLETLAFDVRDMMGVTDGGQVGTITAIAITDMCPEHIHEARAYLDNSDV